MKRRLIVEVCAYSIEGALRAQEGGADRVEFCAAQREGGITPSYGGIEIALATLRIPVHVIIRPREGDFLYSDAEFSCMRRDVAICKELGAQGVVLGILRADGTVDTERCGLLAEEARPLSITFHRAFDVAADLNQALEDVIRIGCDRILSSGGESTALLGARALQKLSRQAGRRIVIMPGGGVSESTVGEIIKTTGANEIHTSARSAQPSAMLFRNERISMSGKPKQNGGNDEYSEYSSVVVAPRIVRAIRAEGERAAAEWQ